MQQLSADLERVTNELSTQKQKLGDLKATQNQNLPENFEDDLKVASLPEHILTCLWKLNGAFKETQAFSKASDLENWHSSLANIDKCIDALHSIDSNSFLEIDAKTRRKELANEFQTQIQTKFGDSAKISATQLFLSADEEAETVWKLAPQTAAFIPQIEPLIDNLLNLTVLGEIHDGTYQLKPVTNPTISEFCASLTEFVKYIAKANNEARKAIPKRYSSYLVRKIIDETLPQFLPTNKQDLSSMQNELAQFTDLQQLMLENHWHRAGEIDEFILNLDSQWQEFKQTQLCSQLRQVLLSADLSNREQLITAKPEEPQEEEKDDWDWNDEDDGLEESADGTNAPEGSIVSLFKQYTSDLDTPLSKSMLVQLYMALTPLVYKNEDLHLYTDTMKLVSHFPDLKDLNQFGNMQLKKYTKQVLEEFKYSLLPPSFAEFNTFQLKQRVSEIAEQTNLEGGANLRIAMIEQVLEQIAVYINQQILDMPDIGDEESRLVASYIASLDTLLVFVPDIERVPSWHKLTMISKLLTSKLREIQEMLDQNMLLDFSAQELAKLVSGLFVESEFRSSLIRNIYSSI